jgi:hypothetical protein
MQEIRWIVAGEQAPRTTPYACFLSKFSGVDFRIWPSGRVFTVQFAVLADGRLAGFQILPEDVPPDLACAAVRAFTACPWTPGRDADCRPTAFWLKVPMRSR